MKVFISVLTLLAAATANAGPAVPLSQAEALVRAEAAARESGYDLKKFRLNGDKGILMPGNKVWLFNFVCAPFTPPDCGFFVEVQRDSGKVTLSPMG